MHESKILIVGITALAATAGAWWIAASAWRAHHHLVTLHVRNAPVGEVLRAIRKQTGDEIKVDAQLDGLITLNLKHKPLTEVLDRITQQCGADWSTVYAVYSSPQALRALEAALPGESKLQEAGWKKIAPNEIGGPGLNQDIQLPGPAQSLPGLGRVVTETQDVVERDVRTNHLKTESDPEGHRQNRPRVIVVRKRGDNGVMEQEVWSPVELLLEARLSAQLTNDFSGAASYEEALQAASEVSGRLKIYYVLRKSKLGMGLVGMPHMQRRFVTGGPGSAGHQQTPGGIDGTGPHLSMPGQNLEEAVRQQKLEELGRLTPEQRVLRSRERPHPNQP